MQERLLGLLARERILATFFLQGRWVEAYPQTAGLVVEAGHLIGSHSFYHARMPLFSDQGFEEDVRSAERVLAEIVGVDPRPWFRCPFGEGADDPRVLARLGALGYRNIHWNVGPDDWDPARTPRQVEDTVVDEALAHGDGAVVLLHTWPSNMITALPGLLARLRDGGAEFVRLDQLPAFEGSAERG